MLLTTNEKTCATLVVALLSCAANAAAQQPIKTLYGFTGLDGEQPVSLVLAAGKTIYGTTAHGGAADGGTAFELAPPASPGGAWTETTLYSFPDTSVGTAYPTVSFSKGGILYGVTQNGGAAEHGTVFQLTPPASPGGPWTEVDLYVFSGGSDGGEPKALAEQDGVLYGVASAGGNSGCGFGCGVFFSLTPLASPGGAWTENLLYAFAGLKDSAQPNSLTIGKDGGLFGTGAAGGSAGRGTVFALVPPASTGGLWTEDLLYSFQSSGDADFPLGVAIGSGGVLYGASLDGGITAGPCGSVGCGTVFALTPPVAPSHQWTESILYEFVGGAGGLYPVAGVTVGSDGVLYGTTNSGDENGVLYSLTPPASGGGAWTETVLHGFYYGGGGGSDASYPSTGVLMSPGGILYGGTSYGGPDGHGAVYRMRP